MALKGGAAITIWEAIEPAMVAEHDVWHAIEHIPERLAVPGFIRGRRYVAVDPSALEQRFIFYEIESIAVTTSPGYLERLNNPTPWSQKIMAAMRLNRTLCRAIASIGTGVGGHLLALRLSPREGRESALRDWLAGEALPGIAALPDILGSHLLQKDQGTVRPLTGEERLRRGGADASANWIVLVEAGAAQALEPAAREALAQSRVRDKGGDAEPAMRYTLAQVATP